MVFSSVRVFRGQTTSSLGGSCLGSEHDISHAISEDAPPRIHLKRSVFDPPCTPSSVDHSDLDPGCLEAKHWKEGRFTKR